MKMFLFSLTLIFLSFGCAVSYNVGINGYSSSGRNIQIQQESSVYVVSDSNSPNPILEKEVGTKIQKLLSSKGYIAGTEDADYYLLFDFGMRSEQTMTDTIGIYNPNIYYDYPYSSTYRYSYTTYMPYSTVVFTRWLVLKLIDGKAYRTNAQAEPLWIGELTSAGPSSDLREVINYMLIAAFEHFGQDTGKRVNELFSENDERVLLLIELWNSP